MSRDYFINGRKEHTDPNSPPKKVNLSSSKALVSQPVT